MAQHQKVRFIRKKGKIIPIRAKNGDKKITSQKVRRVGSKIIAARGKKDVQLAKSGRKAAKFSVVASGLSLAVGILSKGKLKGLGLGGAGLFGLSAISNLGFAQGREASAKIRKRSAKAIATGGVLKLDTAPIGAASQRAVKEFIQIRALDKQARQGFRGRKKRASGSSV